VRRLGWMALGSALIVAAAVLYAADPGATLARWLAGGAVAALLYGLITKR